MERRARRVMGRYIGMGGRGGRSYEGRRWRRIKASRTWPGKTRRLRISRTSLLMFGIEIPPVISVRTRTRSLQRARTGPRHAYFTALGAVKELPTPR